MSIFDRFLLQLGPKLAPKLTSKSFRNRSKSPPKSIQNGIWFLIDFLIDFWSILIDFRPQNQPKTNPKSKKKSSQQHNYQKMKKLISTRQGRWNRALGHVTLGTKISKNRPNIIHKTALKSMLHFWSILDPTWLHFGRLLEAKMGPSWLQMAPKVDSKNGTKNDHLLDRFKIDFWSILGPNLAPKRCHSSLHFGAFFALGASWAQDAPKTPPRGLLGAPRPLQDASWDRF